MLSRIFSVAAALMMLCGAANALCSNQGGCGPDNDLRLDSGTIRVFSVPPGFLGRVQVSFDGECEQAAIFYSADLTRIARFGTHQSDTGREPIERDGLSGGTYFVGGYMKFAGSWRNSSYKIHEQNDAQIVIGWDDHNCRNHPPDGDYNDIVLTVRLEKVAPTTENKGSVSD